MRVVRPDVTLPAEQLDNLAADTAGYASGRCAVGFRHPPLSENAVLQLAEMAREQEAEIILITDRWVSPAAAHARHTLACHIEAPSAWDSNVSLMVLVETLLASVQDLTWDVTEGRMKRLEHLYDRTRFFRRHR